jgi:hypothetical protein
MFLEIPVPQRMPIEITMKECGQLEREFINHVPVFKVPSNDLSLRKTPVKSKWPLKFILRKNRNIM